MDPAAIVALATAINDLAATVIKSQPVTVQADLWQRHITLTQPLYLILAKAAGIVDAMLQPKPSAA